MDPKEFVEKETKVVKNWLKNFKTGAKHAGNVLLLCIALVAGFFIGQYYYVYMDKTNHRSPMKEIKTITTTSVAISERNELLIINRATGDYTVYGDSVGMAIFKMYANKMYEEVVPAAPEK